MEYRLFVLCILKIANATSIFVVKLDGKPHFPPPPPE